MKGIKACKKCKTLTDSNSCPNCQSTQLMENWKGRIIILKPEESEIAKKINISKKGEYTLKT